ncbi:MAG: hypothetical protein AB1726_12305 [Planctomycetota bacterium]
MTARESAPLPSDESARLACLARLISPVVHRVNNSLAVLRGACELALQQGYSAHLQRAGDATSLIVDTLVQLGSFAKVPPPGSAPFDLRAAVQSALLLIEPFAGVHGAELSTYLGPALPLVVHGDRARLEQLLVWFAAEGLDAGGPAEDRPRARIRILLAEEGSRVRLSLRRGGSGEPERSACAAAARTIGAAAGFEVERDRRLGRARALVLAFAPLAPIAASSGAGAAPARAVAPVLLLVEGDTPRRELVRAVLEESGYRVRIPAGDPPRTADLSFEAADAMLVDARLADAQPDLLPELVRAAAARGTGRLGILGAAARTAGAERLPVLVEPFRPGELLDFVGALLA